MTITQYWLHSTEDDPVAGPFDTVNEALEASTPDPDDQTAVVAYEFEYSDSYLIDPRFTEWPPVEVRA